MASRNVARIHKIWILIEFKVPLTPFIKVIAYLMTIQFLSYWITGY
jgi:hypothetical protein